MTECPTYCGVSDHKGTQQAANHACCSICYGRAVLVDGSCCKSVPFPPWERAAVGRDIHQIWLLVDDVVILEMAVHTFGLLQPEDCSLFGPAELELCP